jgi:hypothetical protein
MIISNSVDASYVTHIKLFQYSARFFYHEEGTMERKVAFLPFCGTNCLIPYGRT